MFTEQDSRRIAASLAAIAALAGLVIVVINTHSLFPEPIFYSIVVVLIIVIVILVGEAFFWIRISNYINGRLRRRKQNALAREYFEDFVDYVNRFTSLPEFRNASQGIIGILNELAGIGTKETLWIQSVASQFGRIVQNPLNELNGRLNNLRYDMSAVNEGFLSSLAKEFEGYIVLHKQLYVDFVVVKAREIELKIISNSTKRNYREYREEYNQFIIAYTEFAKKTAKERIYIFNQNLSKASDLE